MRQFIGLYFKDNWKRLLAVLIWQGIIFLAIFLEGVKFERFSYAIWLSLFGIACFVAVDFTRQLQRHNKLALAKEHVDMTTENFPEAVNLIEEDYRELVEVLFNDNRRIDLDRKKHKEDMTEFITLWTHQVKTPLTALQLVAQEIEGPERTAITGRLFEIEQYCDMILQYLRMDGNSTDYVLERYQVKSMVNQSVKYFSRTFISKGIGVKIDIADDAYIVTDEKWLVFALKQIISNSLKYTEKGTITIDMPTPNSIRITDTGIGISPEDLPRIFERGYTGYNGRKDKKATGIGLFLVKGIIERLNGNVQIESTLGEGTSVTCNLTNL